LVPIEQTAVHRPVYAGPGSSSYIHGGGTRSAASTAGAA
jgi:hypothetical protein